MSQEGRGPGQPPPPPGWGTPPTQQQNVPYGHAPPTAPMGPAGYPPFPPPFPAQGQPQQPYPQQPYPQQPYPQHPQQPHPQHPQFPPPQPFPQQGYPQQQPVQQQPYPYPPQYGAMQPYGYQQPMIVVQNHVQQPYPAMHPDRKKKDTAILLCFVAFVFGIHGLHRFYLRDTGLGVVYFLTFGLCGIGQLIDGVKLATMSQQEFDMQYNTLR